MKIPPARCHGFVRNPDPDLHAVLIYGPDSGLVRERAEALVTAVAGTLDDAFRIAEIAAPDLRDDPARLWDEAAALSLTGGRRVVRVRNGSDGSSELFADFLERAAASGSGLGALVIVEAGELRPRSALRKLFETAEHAAALPCYLDAGRGLETVIRETLGKHGLTVTPEALAYLADHLGGDRAITRSELDKLALYVEGRNEVGVEDAAACIGDCAARGLEDLAYAAAGGDQAELDRTLNRVYSQGTSPVAVLRAAARHFQRLHFASGMISAGESVDKALDALRPRPFFKTEPRFRAQLKTWSLERIGTALDLLMRAELECKTTRMPAAAICARALMGIAHAARRS